MKSKGNRWITNNLFALKLLWGTSPRRVIHILFTELLGYFEWVFYQIIFIRYIISCLETHRNIEQVFMWVGICGVVFFIVSLYGSYVRCYVIPQTDTAIYKEIYLKLYTKACNVELSCYEDSDFYNKYMMALDNAAYRIVSAVDGLFKMICGFLASLVIVYMIVLMDWKAAIFMIFPFLGTFVFGKKANDVIYKRYVEDVINQREVKYLDRVMRISNYAKELRYSAIYSLLSEKFKTALDKTEKVMEKYGNRCAGYITIKNILTFPIVFEGIMLYSAFQVMILGNMSIADLAVIFTTMSSASWILIGLFNTITEMIKNGITISYIMFFLQYKEKIPEDQAGILPDGGIESIEFRNVGFSYKKEKPLIENLSLTILKGQSIALIGDNGAGKTTLIKLLLRLYDPLEGEILVNGIDIRKYNLRAYRKWFGVAFQDFKLLAISVKDNVLMGSTGTEEDVVGALKEVGIYEKISSLEKQINTSVSKELDQMGELFSGGEIQKIAVARAMAKHEAAVLVFDEPTKALDPLAEYDMYKHVLNDNQDKIRVIITHRLSSVRDADMIILFKDGKVVEWGKHQELMSRNGYYEEMYKKQAEAYLVSAYN